jgi:hypothetical protein
MHFAAVFCLIKGAFALAHGVPVFSSRNFRSSAAATEKERLFAPSMRHFLDCILDQKGKNVKKYHFPNAKQPKH